MKHTISDRKCKHHGINLREYKIKDTKRSNLVCPECERLRGRKKYRSKCNDVHQMKESLKQAIETIERLNDLIDTTKIYHQRT